MDRHVLGGKKDKLALIWESPETNQRKTFTYSQLHKEVNCLASAFKKLGITKGDRIIIYLPMVPEAIFAMLATVRLGAGHRLGTREVEEALSGHPKVAEASAIGVADEIKGQAIAAFIVLKHDIAADEIVEKELKNIVREKIGAIAIPRDIKFVKALPKTRSGKVMRRVLKAICEGVNLGDISTIEDESIVDEIRK